MKIFLQTLLEVRQTLFCSEHSLIRKVGFVPQRLLHFYGRLLIKSQRGIWDFFFQESGSHLILTSKVHRLILSDPGAHSFNSSTSERDNVDPSSKL